MLPTSHTPCTINHTPSFAGLLGRQEWAANPRHLSGLEAADGAAERHTHHGPRPAPHHAQYRGRPRLGGENMHDTLLQYIWHPFSCIHLRIFPTLFPASLYVFLPFLCLLLACHTPLYHPLSPNCMPSISLPSFTRLYLSTWLPSLSLPPIRMPTISLSSYSLLYLLTCFPPFFLPSIRMFLTSLPS